MAIDRNDFSFPDCRQLVLTDDDLGIPAVRLLERCKLERYRAEVELYNEVGASTEHAYLTRAECRALGEALLRIAES